MKILHVIRDLSPETGGPVAAIHGLSSSQRQLGHEVCTVATDYGLPPDGAPLGEGYETPPCTIASWRYAPQLAELLAEKMAWCDVVHIHTVWEYPTLLAARLAIKWGKPFLLRPCGMLDSWSLSQSRLRKALYLKLFSGKLFHAHGMLHFTTEGERNKSVYPKGMGSVVLPNGISKDAFLPQDKMSEFFKEFPELEGKKLLLFLGRVDPKKQPDVLIRSFASIADISDELHLVIAGPTKNAYQSILEQLVENLDLGSRVTFTGMLQGAVLYSAYRASKLYILPSKQENFGISVVEAMAGYCPVIISGNVDIKDVVVEANAGIVCDAEPNELANAIKNYLENPALCRLMGENGRRIAEELFSWGNVARQLDNVYEMMLSRNSGRGM